MFTELWKNPLYVEARADLKIFLRHLETAFEENDADEVVRYLGVISDHSKRFSAALKSEKHKC